MTETASNREYRYVGIPLIASIAAKLIIELFPGRIAERKTIADRVLATHMNAGGAAPRSDVNVVIKNALKHLRVEGSAINISAGHWKIGNAPDVAQPELTPPDDPTSSAVDSLPIVDPLPSDLLELGEGPEAVYLYYLPTYRVLAEKEGRSFWPCKIGRTSGDPLTRIAFQAATALPEPPHMAALLWTPNSQDWERAFHNVLAVKGRRVVKSPGVEWFETSPSEFVEIATWIDPKLHPEADEEAD